MPTCSSRMVSLSGFPNIQSAVRQHRRGVTSPGFVTYRSLRETFEMAQLADRGQVREKRWLGLLCFNGSLSSFGPSCITSRPTTPTPHPQGNREPRFGKALSSNLCIKKLP